MKPAEIGPATLGEIVTGYECFKQDRVNAGRPEAQNQASKRGQRTVRRIAHKDLLDDVVGVMNHDGATQRWKGRFQFEVFSISADSKVVRLASEQFAAQRTVRFGSEEEVAGIVQHWPMAWLPALVSSTVVSDFPHAVHDRHTGAAQLDWDEPTDFRAEPYRSQENLAIWPVSCNT